MAVVIQTERLTLIPLTKDHVDAHHAIWSDPQATQWSLRGLSATREATAEWMAGILRTPEHDNRRSWAVYVSNALQPDQCIGSISICQGNSITAEDAFESSEWTLGYIYRPQYWSKGYATESCKAAIESLRTDLEGTTARRSVRLVAHVDPANQGSLRVAEKLGFTVVEHKKPGGARRFLGGDWRDDGYLVLSRYL